jgi:phospholipase C
VLAVAAAVGCGSLSSPAAASSAPQGIHKIRHVIVIMEENRSFDSFFGTYPHADGIPRKHGVPTVCVPNGVGGCVRPFLHRSGAGDSGGAHGTLAAKRDVNGGRMNGFIRVADPQLIRTCRADRRASACTHLRHPNVMSHYDARQIPNYWAYARNFVLQDHLFESNWGSSLPAHLYLVSGWSAQCRNAYRAGTCTTNLANPQELLRRLPHGPIYGWTDLTFLLH